MSDITKVANQKLNEAVYIVLFANHSDDYNTELIGVYLTKKKCNKIIEEIKEFHREHGFEVPYSWQFTITPIRINSKPFYLM